MSVPQLASPRGLIMTPGGLIYGANGQKIIPVHHSGPGNLSDAPAWWAEDGRTTVAAAISLCRSGRGDVIQMLPGHTETITAADAWDWAGKTGIIVRGPDYGPPATITWGAAGTTVLLDANDIMIDGNDNTVFNLEPGTGTVTVAAPITVSAARCSLLNMRWRAGTDANNKTTIALTTAAGADDLLIQNVRAYSAVAAGFTTMFQFVAANRLRFFDNYITGASTSATVGPVRFLTTLSADILMLRNVIQHTVAASSNAITFMAGCTGFVDDLRMGVLADAANNLVINNAAGAIVTAGAMQFGANIFVSNTFAERAAGMTLVSA